MVGTAEGALGAQSAREARDQLRNRPLAFEENRGQTDSRVRFLARGEGYLLFLTPSEAVVRLRSLQGEAASAPALRLRWLGARALPGIAGDQELPGASHYLIGRKPADWKTGIAFVVKPDPKGALVYATYLGGSLGEWGSGIAVDPRGSAYLAGGTFSPDFPS